MVPAGDGRLMAHIRIQEEPFDIAAEQARLRQGHSDIGALVSFTGIVRGDDFGKAVNSITLEHYPAMTMSELEAIAAEAAQRWPLKGVTIIHRVGRLRAGDDIVLVLAASQSREAAFAAASFLMDWLKTRAPFWKAEETAAGTNWVEARASDEDAAARWNK